MQTKQKRTQKQSYKTHPLLPETEATLVFQQMTYIHCVSKKPDPRNCLLQLRENCLNINKNWYTQPAYDVVKLQYYKTYITLSQQH